MVKRLRTKVGSIPHQDARDSRTHNAKQTQSYPKVTSSKHYDLRKLVYDLLTDSTARH